MLVPILLAAVFQAADVPAGAAPADGIEWRGDLAAAEREAAASHRPLLIVFR